VRAEYGPHRPTRLSAARRGAGTLPANWGTLPAWPQLRALALRGAGLGGALPRDWAAENGFPLLMLLDLGRNRLAGTLPDTWGACGALCFEYLHYMCAAAPGRRAAPPQRRRTAPGPARRAACPEPCCSACGRNVPVAPGQPACAHRRHASRVLASRLTLRGRRARSFLDGNQLQGHMPRTWASKGAFRTLYTLCARASPAHARHAARHTDCCAGMVAAACCERATH